MNGSYIFFSIEIIKSLSMKTYIFFVKQNIILQFSSLFLKDIEIV